MPLVNPADTLESASNIAFTPHGNISSTNVQAALQEEVDDLAASSGSSLVGFVSSGTGATSESVQDELRRRALTPFQFGAVGDGTTDDQTALAACFLAAIAAGRDVYIPGFTFAHSSTLAATGITVFGDGDKSILKSTSGTASAVVLSGTRPAIRNVRLTGASSATVSTTNPNAAAVFVSIATRFKVEGISTTTFRYQSIAIQGSTDGLITGNRMEDAFGGVFLTNPTGFGDCKRIVISKNVISGMKDDGIASVAGDVTITSQNEDIKIIDNVVYDCAVSRGIVMLGTTRGQILGNTLKNISAAAGILIGNDSTFSTQQCDDCLVANNMLTDCGTSGLSAVMLVAHGTETSTDIAFRDNIVINGGRAAFSASGAGTPGAIRISYIGNVITTPLTTNAFELDFLKDVQVIGNTCNSIPQHGVSFGTSCSGVIICDGNLFRDCNTGNTASKRYIDAESSSITDLVCNGNIGKSTNTLATGVLNNTATCTLRGCGNSFDATASYSTTLGGLNSFDTTFTSGVAFVGLSTDPFGIGSTHIAASKSSASAILSTYANTNNANAAANSEVCIATGGGSGGDPFLTFRIAGVTNWAAGADNSDSDKFKLSASTGLGTSDQLTLTTGGVLNVAASTATPAAGSTTAVLLFGTTAGFGIYYGSNAPTVSAAKGSLYLRSDGTGTTDRAYINTNGTTTWTALTTVA